MISFFSGATGMIVGIVIVIAVLVIIYCMMQKQAVQFQVKPMRSLSKTDE